MDPTHTSNRVCAQFLCLSLKPMVIKAKRRTGKTRLVCTLAAKLAQTHRVCLVTSSRHEVLSCLQEVASMLPGSHATGDCIHFGNGWVRCVKQAVDADVLLVDNTEYLDPGEFVEGMSRLMENKPMLLIGTPTGNVNNILSRLCKLKDKDGALVFNVIDATQRGPSL
jgi:hypothetical protein